MCYIVNLTEHVSFLHQYVYVLNLEDFVSQKSSSIVKKKSFNLISEKEIFYYYSLHSRFFQTHTTLLCFKNMKKGLQMQQLKYRLSINIYVYKEMDSGREKVLQTLKKEIFVSCFSSKNIMKVKVFGIYTTLCKRNKIFLFPEQNTTFHFTYGDIRTSGSLKVHDLQTQIQVSC